MVVGGGGSDAVVVYEDVLSRLTGGWTGGFLYMSQFQP